MANTFLKLNTEDWINNFEQLTKSELGILYFIKTSDPFSGKLFQISTKAIAEKLKVTVRTVQRGLKTLREKGVIVYESVRTCLVWAVENRGKQCDDKNVAIPTSEDPKATPRAVEVTQKAHSKAESKTEQEVQPSKIYKTNKDSLERASKKAESQAEKSQLDQKLDREGITGEEREKFLNFAYQRVENLPNKPAIAAVWIAKYFNDLYQDFSRSFSIPASAKVPPAIDEKVKEEPEADFERPNLMQFYRELMLKKEVKK